MIRTRKLAQVLTAMAATPGVAGAQAIDTTGPRPTLQAPYATRTTPIFVKLAPPPPGWLPTVPAGFKVVRFAENLKSPRQLLVLPDGGVLVAEAKTEAKPNDPAYRDKGANRIVLLRDTDGDGVADAHSVLLAGLRQPYGMVLLGDRLYVADTDGVFWVPYRPGTTTIADSVRKTRIATFSPGGYNNHWTRNLIASPDGRHLYVAIGSASNAGEYGEAEERRRANILRIDLRTLRETVFADGLRNPVGMDWEPATGVLWTAVNERDELGDNLVLDYITSVRQGAFYGWPYSYFGQHEDPRLKGKRPDLVAKAVVPDYAMGAHVAAVGLAFGSRLRFPAPYRAGAFAGRHGSWNRSSLVGYDVAFVPFRAGRPAGAMQPFLTGLIAGRNQVYGRPRSIATARDGSLLVTDDMANVIYRITAR